METIAPTTHVGKKKPEEITTKCNVGVRYMIDLQLTTQQFNLIGRALSNNMKESEWEVAMELSLNMCKLKLKHEESRHSQSASILEHLENDLECDNKEKSK